MMFDVARSAEREHVGWVTHTVWCSLTRDNVVHVLAGKATVCTVGMLLYPSLAERTPMPKPQMRGLHDFKPMSELGLAIKYGKQSEPHLLRPNRSHEPSPATADDSTS